MIEKLHNAVVAELKAMLGDDAGQDLQGVKP